MTHDSIAVEQLYMEVHSLTSAVAQVATALRIHGQMRAIPRNPILQSTSRRLPGGRKARSVRKLTAAESAAIHDKRLSAAAELVVDSVIQFDAEWRRVRPRVLDMLARAREVHDAKSPPCRIGRVAEVSHLDVAADIFGMISTKFANIPHDHGMTQPPGFRDALLQSWAYHNTLEHETLSLVFEDLSEKTVKSALDDLCVHLKRECLDIQRMIALQHAKTRDRGDSQVQSGSTPSPKRRLTKPEVAKGIRSHLRRAAWPGYEKMSRLLKCSPSWVHKTVKDTPGLAAQVNAASKTSTGGHGARSRKRTAANEADPNALDPADVAQARDSEEALRRLIAASPECRATVNRLTDKQRQKLAEDLAAMPAADRESMLDTLVQDAIRERPAPRKRR